MPLRASVLLLVGLVGCAGRPASTPAAASLPAAPAQLAPMPPDCSREAAPAHPLVAGVGAERLVPTATLWRAGSISDGGEPDFLTYRFEFAATDAAGGPVELDVTVLVPVGVPLDGRSFRKLPIDDTSAQPGPESGTPEVQGWGIERPSAGVDASPVFEIASLRLDVGTRRGRTLPARVRLCAPEVAGGSQLAGAFEVTLPEE